MDMRILWRLGTLALAVAAALSCGITPDPPDKQTLEEPTRTLTIVCWQDDGGRFLDLSDAGKGKGEGRIELHRKGIVKAWFDSFLVPSFDASSTGKMVRALLEKSTGDVSIYVFDAANQGTSLLVVVSRASKVCEEANVVFRVEYRRGAHVHPM
jgi:hypothetical protein